MTYYATDIAVGRLYVTVGIHSIEYEFHWQFTHTYPICVRTKHIM